MRMEPGEILSGELLDDELLLTLDELCQRCSVEAEAVIHLVEEGVVEAGNGDIAQWRFGIRSFRRVRTAARLQRDLGVNLAGAALALELLERIAELERGRKGAL